MNLFNRSFKANLLAMSAVAVLVLTGCAMPTPMPESVPDAMSTPTVALTEVAPPQAEPTVDPMQESMGETMAVTETMSMTESMTETMAMSDTVPMSMTVEAEMEMAATPTPMPEPMPTSTPQPEAATPGQTVNVALDLFLFKPDRIEINVGDMVMWTNTDDIQHTVTFGVPDAPGTLFDSGFFTLNQTFSHTFTEPGEYAYFCQRHPHMQGVIVVK